MKARRILLGAITVAMIIAGIVIKSGVLIWIGLFGLLPTLFFTQLDRWHDRDQTELYLPTYKKEWEDTGQKTNSDIPRWE
ncbi:MAG: hypothetical protein ACYC6L_17750 [Anaerolineae bacterium]